MTINHAQAEIWGENKLSSTSPLEQAIFLFTGVDILPTLRVLFAEIAACCSSMASAMKFRKGLQRVKLFHPDRVLVVDTATHSEMLVPAARP